jgi:hypothetical protein
LTLLQQSDSFSVGRAVIFLCISPGGKYCFLWGFGKKIKKRRKRAAIFVRTTKVVKMTKESVAKMWLWPYDKKNNLTM